MFQDERMRDGAQSINLTLAILTKVSTICHSNLP